MPTEDLIAKCNEGFDHVLIGIGIKELVEAFITSLTYFSEMLNQESTHISHAAIAAEVLGWFPIDDMLVDVDEQTKAIVKEDLEYLIFVVYEYIVNVIHRCFPEQQLNFKVMFNCWSNDDIVVDVKFFN